jgi:choline dehydrogenase-like flavoprotein
LKFPQGKVLGGTSTINGMLFVGPSKCNIDSWARLGNPGWDWETFSSAMKRSFAVDGSGDGPVQLSRPENPDEPWPRLWSDTLAQLGYLTTRDAFSGDVCGGLVSTESVDPKTKQRSSVVNTYYAAARNRPNLSVITSAMVSKILLDTSDPNAIKATGLEYSKDGMTRCVECRKEVIVTAGTLNSPKLLEISGIGGKENLERIGVHAVIDNPYVGENLQNHIVSGFSFEVQDGLATMDCLSRQEPEAMQKAMADLSEGKGPLSRASTGMMAQMPLANAGTEEMKRNIRHLLSEPLTNADSGIAAAFQATLDKFVEKASTSDKEASAVYVGFPAWASFSADGSLDMTQVASVKENYFSIVFWLAQPRSTGAVHATSASAFDLPAVDPRYLSHPVDLEVLARHALAVHKMAETEPLAHSLKKDGKRVVLNDIDDAKAYLQDTLTGAHHWTGSCSMMPREMGGVVDEKLRVHGCQNLRVCDASIIPVMVRGNPQAAVYGVAERASEIIKESLL